VAIAPDASGNLVGAFTSIAATNSIGGLILDEFAPAAAPTDFRIVEWRQTGQVGDTREFAIAWNSRPAETYRIDRSTDGRIWTPVPGADDLPSQGLRSEHALSFDAADPTLLVRVVRK
jgi:hypothetical protein